MHGHFPALYGAQSIHFQKVRHIALHNNYGIVILSNYLPVNSTKYHKHKQYQQRNRFLDANSC